MLQVSATTAIPQEKHMLDPPCRPVIRHRMDQARRRIYSMNLKLWFFALVGIAVASQWMMLQHAIHGTVLSLQSSNGRQSDLAFLQPPPSAEASRSLLQESRTLPRVEGGHYQGLVDTPTTYAANTKSGSPSLGQSDSTNPTFPPSAATAEPNKSTYTSFHWQDPDRFRFYKPDLMCSGCYQRTLQLHESVVHENGTITVIVRNTTCGELVWNETRRIRVSGDDPKLSKNRTAATLQAATVIARQHPDQCHACDPTSCPETHKIYLRIDDAAPTILRAWTRPISKILPKSKVFPKEGVQDPKAFFANPNNKYSPTKKWFWEYNPSLVAIQGHEHLIPPGVIKNNNQQQQEVAFLSTNRESIIPTTFFIPGRHKLKQKELGKFPNQWQRFEHINFSFLSHDNMSVIQEGIFNVGYADYRLFILNEQLYLGVWNRIYPMWIRPASNFSSSAAREKGETLTTTTATYTEGHRVKILRDIYQPKRCPFELHVAEQHLCCANGCKGKNFNYFTTRDGTMWVQTRPAAPLEVQKVVPCNARYWEDWWTQAPHNDHDSNETTTSYVDQTVPTMSFGTVDETYLASRGVFANDKLSQHRGTACCVRMRYHSQQQQQQPQELLVGISHRRDKGNPAWKSKNLQYTSNFYATLPEPPFSLVAMSGSFCLGHPKPEDEAMNHLVPLTRIHNYTFGGIHYEKCPMISFLHTMVEHPSNRDTVIIGYGINDMINRFVEVSKANILQLLFDPYRATLPSSNSQSSMVG